MHPNILRRAPKGPGSWPPAAKPGAGVGRAARLLRQRHLRKRHGSPGSAPRTTDGWCRSDGPMSPDCLAKHHGAVCRSTRVQGSLPQRTDSPGGRHRLSVDWAVDGPDGANDAELLNGSISAADRFESPSGADRDWLPPDAPVGP